jgi:hypothetical protein
MQVDTREGGSNNTNGDHIVNNNRSNKNHFLSVGLGRQACREQ